MKRHLARAAAWIGTIALLGWVLSRVSFRDVGHAVANAAPWTVPMIVLLTVLVYVSDTFAIWRTFGWFVVRLRFTEVLALRGATYPLALVNYSVGQVAMVLFLRRSRGVTLRRSGAAILLIMGINLLVLLFLATLGLLLGADLVPLLKTLIFAAYGGLALYALLVAWKPPFLRSRAVFDVLLEAGLAGHVKAMLVRLPHVFSLLVLNFLSLRAFGVKVPVVQAVLCLPIVFFVTVLPISVQGLGTTQAALTFFFARFADGPPAMQTASVVASSLGTQAVATAVQILIGIYCLNTQVGRDLKKASAAPPPAQEPASA
jgi:hypothetical protein